MTSVDKVCGPTLVRDDDLYTVNDYSSVFQNFLGHFKDRGMGRT